MAQLEMHLTGTGIAILPPERAILVLSLHSQEQSKPKDAIANVTATAKVVRDYLAPHCPQDQVTGAIAEDAAISHYSTSTLETNNIKRECGTKDNGDTKYETFYYARAEFHIKFAHFGILNLVATQLSAMKNIEVRRVEWKLTDDTYDSIKSGARKGAAEDALQRAYDYAETFAGVLPGDMKRKVRAVDVKESSYYNTSTRPQLHARKGARGMRSDSADFQFMPEDVRLEVKVDAKFVVHA